MIINENLQTKVVDQYDVIVCGGGPAGVGAAVGAARQGMKTLLIEQYGCLGGMWTTGLVNPLFDHENKKGVVREIVDELQCSGAFGAFWDKCFDIERMKLLLDNLCEETGVTVLFHTYFSCPIMDGFSVKGVIVENKSGRQAYTASVVIDCTGDGDVAARTGAEFKIGRDKDSATQAMTLMFLLGNITYMQDDSTQLYALMKKAVDNFDTKYEIGFTSPFIIKLPIGNYAVVQLTHIYDKSGIDALSLSQAEQIGRKKVMETFKLFKKYIPEFKDVDLVSTAAQIGVRETRRIVGEYTVTLNDIRTEAKFNDSVVDVGFGVDIHAPDSVDQVCMESKQYQIPYRCLLPKGIKNLLVAGRCISGDFEAHASYRVTGNCMAMGEAAGFAAALAVKGHVGVNEVDIGALKKLLNRA